MKEYWHVKFVFPVVVLSFYGFGRSRLGEPIYLFILAAGVIAAYIVGWLVEKDFKDLKSRLPGEE